MKEDLSLDITLTYMNLSWFENGGLNYLNLKSNSNKIRNKKHKSHSNGNRPFYYFHNDSYTRIIYKDLLHKNKKKKNYKIEATYYKLKFK